MSIYTNAEIQAQYLPLNINRRIPNNFNSITVQRPNNSIRIWDLLESYVDNNLPNAELNLYTSDGTLKGLRLVDLNSYDLIFRRGNLGSELSTLSLDASSGRVGINAATNETFGTLHVKSNTLGADAAVLSIADTTNTQIMKVADSGIVRTNNYGLGNNSDISTGTTASVYIAGFSTDGTIIEIDGTSLGAGGGSNYANTSLTASGIRTHTWGTYTQTETFTTGAFNQNFDDGVSVNAKFTQADLNVQSISTGGAFTSIGNTTSTVEFTSSDSGDFTRLNLNPTNIDLIFTNSSLNIDGSAGTAGQYLMTNGSATPPSWSTIISGNYAMESLTADDPQVHTWDTYDQTENFTSGTFYQNFINGAQNNIVSKHAGGNSYVTSVGSTSIGSFNNLALHQIYGFDGTSQSQLVVRPNSISMNFVNAALQIDASFGNPGQVLTSQGNSTGPIWKDITEFNVTKTDVSYLVVSTDELIIAETNPGITITLPATPTLGKKYIVKQTTTSTIIAGNGNTIDGLANYILPLINQASTFVYDGADWVII